jgi:hypothetical protein
VSGPIKQKVDRFLARQGRDGNELGALDPLRVTSSDYDVATAPGWEKAPNVDGRSGVIQYQKPTTRAFKVLSHRSYYCLVGHSWLTET